MPHYLISFFIFSAFAGICQGDGTLELTSIACEQNDLTLRCPYNNLIEVYYAEYGRKRSDICQDYPSITGSVFHLPNSPISGYISNTKCQSQSAADQATRIVKSMCDMKSSCTVQADFWRIFGDPCVSTYKYLTVSYRCVDPEKTSITCENFDATLSCPNATAIRTIGANYGRTSNDICLDYPNMSGAVYQPLKVPNSYTQNVNCSNNTATSIVTSKCDTKQNCTIRAENSVFGEPCVGTYKYLEIAYKCVKLQ